MKKRNVFVDISGTRCFRDRTSFLKWALAGIKGKLLDVGNLGDGPLMVDIRSMVESQGGEHWGLDCNKNLAEKLGNPRQYIGDLHDLKGIIEDASFDAIYAGEIIEHTWSPGKMILECHRILKPGGTLVLDTPNAFCLQSILRFFVKKKDTVGLDDPLFVYNEAKDNFQTFREVDKQVLSQPQHKIFYRPAMMRQLLNMHGFEIEHYVFITKPQNLVMKILLTLFPQGGQKIGIIARKSDLESIFGM